jgi:hypothetical protein
VQETGGESKAPSPFSLTVDTTQAYFQLEMNPECKWLRGA